MKWDSVGSFYSKLNHPTRHIIVQVTVLDKKWIAIAIETQKLSDNMDEIFGEHGHFSIGKFDSPNEAFNACEKFATEFPGINKCNCEEIKIDVHEKSNNSWRDWDLSEIVEEVKPWDNKNEIRINQSFGPEICVCSPTGIKDVISFVGDCPVHGYLVPP